MSFKAIVGSGGSTAPKNMAEFAAHHYELLKKFQFPLSLVVSSVLDMKATKSVEAFLSKLHPIKKFQSSVEVGCQKAQSLPTKGGNAEEGSGDLDTGSAAAATYICNGCK